MMKSSMQSTCNENEQLKSGAQKSVEAGSRWRALQRACGHAKPNRGPTQRPSGRLGQRSIDANHQCFGIYFRKEALVMNDIFHIHGRDLGFNSQFTSHTLLINERSEKRGRSVVHRRVGCPNWEPDTFWERQGSLRETFLQRCWFSFESQASCLVDVVLIQEPGIIEIFTQRVRDPLIFVLHPAILSLGPYSNLFRNIVAPRWDKG